MDDQAYLENLLKELDSDSDEEAEKVYEPPGGTSEGQHNEAAHDSASMLALAADSAKPVAQILPNASPGVSNSTAAVSVEHSMQDRQSSHQEGHRVLNDRAAATSQGRDQSGNAVNTEQQNTGDQLRQGPPDSTAEDTTTQDSNAALPSPSFMNAESAFWSVRGEAGNIEATGLISAEDSLSEQQEGMESLLEGPASLSGNEEPPVSNFDISATTYAADSAGLYEDSTKPSRLGIGNRQGDEDDTVRSQHLEAQRGSSQPQHAENQSVATPEELPASAILRRTEERFDGGRQQPSNLVPNSETEIPSIDIRPATSWSSDQDQYNGRGNTLPLSAFEAVEEQSASSGEGESALEFKHHVEAVAIGADPRQLLRSKNLEDAEERERRLAYGSPSGSPRSGPSGGTHNPLGATSKLQSTLQEWKGKDRTTGGLSLGDQLVSIAEPVKDFNRAIEKNKDTGNMTCLAGSEETLAVGMVSGACLVTELSRPRTDTSGKPSRLSIQQLLLKSTAKAVSALAINVSSQLLVVGHENGDLNFWEHKHTAWENVKSIRDAHTSAVVQAAFLEGTQILAVTAEAEGRIVSHNVTSYLSLAAKIAGKLSKLMQFTLVQFEPLLGEVHLLTGLNPSKSCAIQPPDRGVQPRTVMAYACEGFLLALGSLRLSLGRVDGDGTYRELHTLPVHSPAHTISADLQLQEINSRGAISKMVVSFGGDTYIYQVVSPILSSGPNSTSLVCQLLEKYTSGTQPTAMQISPIGSWSRIQQDGDSIRIATKLSDNSDLENLDMNLQLKHRSRSFRGASARWQDYSNSLDTWSRGTILLTTTGIWVTKLASWTEKIAAVSKCGEKRLAVSLGLQALADDNLPQNDRTEVKKMLEQLALAKIAGIGTSNLELGAYGDDVTAVQMAIDIWLAIGAQDLLWEQLYNDVCQKGGEADLFQGINHAIRKGQLTSLPPGLMQEFVGHFERNGQLETVEAAVMRMDAASMDFNQIFRICRQHKLYSALVHIYSKGFQEYVGPAAELLVAVKLNPVSSGKTASTLLVYLQECLRNHSFPPGSGSLPANSNVPEQLLAFMYFGNLESILLILQDLAFELGSEQAESLRGCMKEPYTVLASLLALDTGGVLSMLLDVFASKFILVSDLQTALSGVSDPESMDISAEQAFLDAIMTLLEDQSFRQSLPDPSKSSNSLLLFVLLSVTEGRVTANARMILRLLAWTCESENRTVAEKQFTDLLVHLDLTDSQQTEEAEKLARTAGFVKAEAHLLDLSGQPLLALQKLMESDPKVAFEYLEDVVQSSQTADRAKSQLCDAAVSLTEKFLQADAIKFAALALAVFPEKCAGLLKDLAGSELKFKFLDSCILVCLNGSRDVGAISSALGNLAKTTRLSESDVTELYLQLLCQFRPEDVQITLENCSSYRVQEILPYCQQQSITSAEAYLYERLGSVKAALLIYKQEALESVQSLLTFVESNQVSLLQVQAVIDDKTPHSQLVPRSSRERQDRRLASAMTDALSKVRKASHLCGRHSQDAESPSVKELWLSLLEGFLTITSRQQTSSRPGTLRQTQQLIVMHVLEDITTDMAIHIPLHLIGSWILEEFSSKEFAFFRSSLISLLSAHNYESNILQTASRLMTSDALKCMETSYLVTRQGMTFD